MSLPKPPSEDYKYSEFIGKFSCIDVSNKIGIALFGVGRAGMIHLKNLMSNTRVSLLYVVEADDARLKKVKDATGLANTQFLNSSQTEKVLSDVNVKAVVITTPTPTHQDIVIQALNKGKPIFCEKPIANNIKEIKKCYDLANNLKLPLHCAFNRRFDPSFVNVYNRVKNGELGKVHVIKSCSRDSPLPSIEYLRTSNGIFHDCAVHDIDLTCWILGEYPSKVFASAVAHMKPIADINDHDTVAMQFSFPSGAMALIDLSRFSIYGYDQRIEVFGVGGMLLCNNEKAIKVESFKGNVVEEAPIWYSFPSRYEEAYKKELDHFLNVLEGKEELIVQPHQTLSVCKVAAACEESVRTGLPITMNYDF